MLLSLTTLSTLVAAVLALPASEFKHVLHEKRDLTSESTWLRSHALEKGTMLPVRIGLTQGNLDKGHDILMGMSDPDSASFGKHMTEDEVINFFKPDSKTVNAVADWLRSSGIHKFAPSVNKQWMQFDVAVEELEALLRTKFHMYEHVDIGSEAIGCDEYHIPQHVQEHIDYITPGIRLIPNKRDAKAIEKRQALQKRDDFKLPPLVRPAPAGLSTSVLAKGSLAACGAAITPACITAMYNITGKSMPVNGSGPQYGIFEDLGDVYAQADLDMFFAALAPQIPQGTHPTLRAIDGAVAPISVLANAGIESDLDFEISYPIVYPEEITLYQTDDPVYENNYRFSGFLNNFFDAIDGSYCTYCAFGQCGNSPLDPPYPHNVTGGYMGALQCGKYQAAKVISISYGGQEPGLPVSYQKRQCNEIMKLGMQGVSVLVASGDSGVQSRGSKTCLGASNKIFNPDFPASCPYITAVGGTVLPPGGDPKADAEIAVTRFPSGGGFSNIYLTPDYQQKAVNTFLTKYPPPYPSYQTADNNNVTDAQANGGIFNSAGRGYPDVAAVGDNVLIFGAGTPFLVGGTSASCPAFASILVRINQQRLAAGKSTVGFVNPTLYKNADVLHDITIGSNPGCGTNGFSCQPGWDPVTGLGTPNFQKMSKLWAKLA